MEKITPNLNFLDLNPSTSDFREDVISGLSQNPKQISPKYFYDRRGSEIYDQITKIPEYYPTRTEIKILEENAPEISDLIGERSTLIEFGCGSSVKIRLLLKALKEIEQYIPIDISRDYLLDMSKGLATDFKDVSILAVCADYTKSLDLSHHLKNAKSKKVIFFPGSTIGNLSPFERDQLLSIAAELVGKGGGLLIGVDLKKEEQVLENAYNDGGGVTAEFNKNLLVRMNQELGANFPLSHFKHQAIYNKKMGRVEMHLISQKDQVVALNGSRFAFQKEETIHTENSYKYTVDEFHSIAKKAGFYPKKSWTDPKNLFSAHFFSVQ